MKRLLSIVGMVLLYSPIAEAQGVKHPPTGTVSQLPTCNANKKTRIFGVTDAADAMDCSTGGGSVANICMCDGSNYIDFPGHTGTVADIPSCGASSKAMLFGVTDGTSSTDCSTGSGSTAVPCFCDGSTWSAVSSASGGGISSGSAFPGSPAQFDLFFITTDSAEGACDASSGSAESLCVYNGAGWVNLIESGYMDYDYGDIAVSGGQMDIESGAVGSTEIASNSIDPDHIDNSWTSGDDGYCLKLIWNGGAGNEYIDAGLCSTATEQDPTLDLSTVNIGTGSGENIQLCFNSTNDKCIVHNYTSGTFEFGADISVPASADAGSSWTDSGTTDEEVSARLHFDCPTTGSGAEDCEAWFRLQHDGAEISPSPAAGSLMWMMDLDDTYDTAADDHYFRVRNVIQSASAVFEDFADADDNYEIFMADYPVKILSVGCHCASGTCTSGAVISLEDRGGNAMTHGTVTCSISGNTSFIDVTANNTLVAGEGLRFDVDTAPNPDAADTYIVSFTYALNTLP
jgi:hypothetical protein